MSRHKLAGIIALVWALVALAACGGLQPQTPAAPTDESAASATEASTPTTEAAELTTIRMGYVPVIIFAPIYVGIESGYFAEEGLELEMNTVQSTNDAVVQLAAGNFDVAGAGGNAGLFNGIERGLQFKIVAPMHSEKPPLATPLVISAGRADELTSIADLRGKRIAVNGNGAAIEYWLDQALAQGGVSIEEVEVVALPFPDMAAALESGSIDAALITEPLVTINRNQELISILADDFINGFTATFIVMNQDWLDQNPELARKFMRAYLRASRDLQGDYMTPEIAAMVEKYTNVPAAMVERSTVSQFSADGIVPVQDLETLQAFFQRRGFLEYDELLDITTFVDTSLAEEVAAELDAE